MTRIARYMVRSTPHRSSAELDFDVAAFVERCRALFRTELIDIAVEPTIAGDWRLVRCTWRNDEQAQRADRATLRAMMSTANVQIA